MPVRQKRTPSSLAVRLRILAVSAATAAFAIPVMADELGDRIQLHGYGDVGYFKSSKLDYAESTRDGNWDGLTSILVIATLNEQSKVWVQLHNTSEKSHLDWAFVDYKLSPKTTLRAGQIKLPLGLYTATIDAAFLRPSTLLPLMYQEAARFVQENFRGADAEHTFNLGTGTLNLTAYGGQIVDDNGASLVAQKRLIGAQAVYVTPIDGLRLMGSIYRARLDVEDRNRPDNGLGNQTTAILSADYVNGQWDAKAEYGSTNVLGSKSRSAYAQLAYTIAERWIPFVRIDHINVFRGQPLERSQTTASAGLSYKLNESVALRLEGHHNRGDALPYSEWLASTPGTPLDPATAPHARSWNNAALSVNFIF